MFKSCASSVRFGRIGELRGVEHICIGESTNFGDDFFLCAWDHYGNGDRAQSFSPELLIGSNCSFGVGIHITCVNRIFIGSGVMTGKWVTITDNAHGDNSQGNLQIPPGIRPLVSKGPVIIEDNVWIGEKVTILPGVTVGRGSVIAANAVVTHDVEPFSVVGGVPALLIKSGKGF